MLAGVSNREIFVPDGDKARKASTRIANALALELLRYGIALDANIVQRITRHKRTRAQSIADGILKLYTIGDLNPPLFQHWEDRTEFTFEEIVVQICGYWLQLCGNDLEDASYMSTLKDKVDYGELKTLTLANDRKAMTRFNELVQSKVALDKKSQKDLQNLAAIFFSNAPERISSDEARIAVVLGMVHAGFTLAGALSHLSCLPADALRFAAAKQEFASVKLPADVMYGKLTWSERKQLIAFLDGFDFETLSEAMGSNRTCWLRFFHHVHLFQQKDFRQRFPATVAAAMVSNGTKESAVPAGRVMESLAEHKKLYEVTACGAMVFRTFAARVQAAVDSHDFEAFESEIRKRPGFLFRNIGSLSNVCIKSTEGQFVDLVRDLVSHASPGVLLSIIQIDVNAEYRIIDSKGNTTVTDSSYSPFIGEIQDVAERELFKRYGFSGQVRCTDAVASKMVPFLSTNADLDRGSRVPFDDAKYLYFLMHWVQRTGHRTDLDHSYVCIDDAWKSETIYFGNQANNYITQSGDITNAPAPRGGTEYGRIDLKKIPSKVRYIVPIMNVYAGDAFSENETAYAGFMFSDEPKFSISRKHVRYDLTQLAQSNIPFVIDVKAKEIIIVDFNNRRSNGLTAHSSIDEIRKVISALKSKRFMTIERFAKLLSGDDETVSLTIKKNAKTAKEIEPLDLQRLVSEETSATEVLEHAGQA